jgi:hypothetical protein
MGVADFVRKYTRMAADEGGTRAMSSGSREAFWKLASAPFDDKIGVYNGVAVRDMPFLRWDDEHPRHKEGLVDAVLAYTVPGDHVAFVGAGRTVAPVRAARAGRHVTVYEAAEEMVELAGEVADLNEVSIEVVHALVEAGYDVFGDSSGAERVKTGDISGDALVLDCEGAERDILPAPQFGTVVVETHPQFGAETDLVAELSDGAVVESSPTDHEGDYLVIQ